MRSSRADDAALEAEDEGDIHEDHSREDALVGAELEETRPMSDDATSACLLDSPLLLVGEVLALVSRDAVSVDLTDSVEADDEEERMAAPEGDDEGDDPSDDFADVA